jgi:hypothetical protein
MIDDGTGAFDVNGNKITIEQSKVNAARTELAKLDYQRKRAEEYPLIVDQLDKIYHSGLTAWKADIKAVKDKFPKPTS